MNGFKILVLLIATVAGAFAQGRPDVGKTQAAPPVASHENPFLKPSFFPVSVWYSGGKARAPMLERITPDSPRAWKEDLQKIKDLGFNTVRTWVEWNVGEPREGEYHL